MAIEQTILANLMYNETYMRKVFPFLKEEYFAEPSTRIIFKHITEFVNKYNTCPNKQALEIAFNNDKTIPEDSYSEIMGAINEFSDEKSNFEWLVNETEKYCKDRAVYNAIVTSIGILDGRDKVHSKDGIPSLLQEALGTCFDSSVGHDYLDDAVARYEFYNKVEDRIPFDLEYFNVITQGGLPSKTLNIALAGTGVGKSLFMCHVAASCLQQNRNVLYITLEMAEERIAERIDANLMDVAIDQLKEIPKSTFENRVKKITGKTTGKLIIKEYPTASAHAGHFKSLLNELALKRNFKPDIIFIDYLNICSSARFKPGSNINSYTLVKAIAEELRGLAVENNVPIVSATQTTRGGYCLDLNTKVKTKRGVLSLSDIQVGDDVLSSGGWNRVITVFPQSVKKMYRITTESGKEIIASEDHLFPTETYEKNIKQGLCLADRLYINNSDI